MDFSELDLLISKLERPRVGSHVTWNSSGGPAYGVIIRIIDKGSFEVPNTQVKLIAEEDNPVAVIDLHDKDHNRTGKVVAHKLNTLAMA
jgi:acyl-coenzyme A synthetase/AMP-(fatty) acid ligase